MNWYQTHRKHLEYLDQYLKGGFDPYDYDFEAAEFVEENYIEFYNNLQDLGYTEPYEIGEAWVGQATEEQLKEFENYIIDKSGTGNYRMETDEPAYVHLSSCGLTDEGWFVHFTSDAWKIVKDGFSFGHDDYRGLGLTTWKSEKYRKESPGYNFAFELGSRDSEIASRAGKYGKEAVIFYGKGLKCHHSGDEEYQIIVWGPSIRKDMIFEVSHGDSGWYVPLANGREVNLDDPTITNAGNWVAQNYNMIRQIEQKSRRPSSR